MRFNRWKRAMRAYLLSEYAVDLDSVAAGDHLMSPTYIPPAEWMRHWSSARWRICDDSGNFLQVGFVRCYACCTIKWVLDMLRPTDKALLCPTCYRRTTGSGRSLGPLVTLEYRDKEIAMISRRADAPINRVLSAGGLAKRRKKACGETHGGPITGGLVNYSALADKQRAEGEARRAEKAKESQI